ISPENWFPGNFTASISTGPSAMFTPFPALTLPGVLDAAVANRSADVPSWLIGPVFGKHSRHSAKR
ncbi:MAG TPA: hypothetical protein VFP05_08540, partial [Thermomicrobiales bacterium]|nr:hypothetical protein [Thermomicrobiales bacterium]